MAMNEIFKNEKFGEVRTYYMDGEPWFVGKDVAESLGYSNTRDAIYNLVEEEDKKSFSVETETRGKQKTTIINESGLYSLVMRSTLPSAKDFKRWITKEVLPSIRKNHMYVTEDLLDDPDVLLQTVQKLKEERDARLALEAKIQKDLPYTQYGKAVTEFENAVPISVFAKQLNENGIDVGEHRLYEWFRQNGWLCKGKNGVNLPSQLGVERGYFVVQENRQQYGKKRKVWITTHKALITSKGRVYFMDLFLEAQKLKAPEQKRRGRPRTKPVEPLLPVVASI